ncbi:MAG: glycosyltransferase family 39 protein [bacterium]|nr:glycosyltransferase family 39 protein [bacterium]
MTKFSKIDFVAGIIIISALALAIFSVKGDSVTTDESPHVTAGYSYLTQNDMRLNPEHPPLMKDLAGIPLLFKNLNIDLEHYSWKTDINGQWTFGTHFLYESGNNPDEIIFNARLAVMLIFVLLGIMVYIWTKERYGAKTGLLGLFLTVFSPNIIANGRYVTTDVAAAFAFVLGTYFFVKFINNQTKKNLLFAGIAFGIAQLLKFSLIILVPLFVFTGIVYWFISKKISFVKLVASLTGIFFIGALVIWPVYQFHVWKYPVERQKADTAFTLRSYPVKPIADAVIWATDKPLLRSYAQYSLGLLMVFQRTGGGNTTYFLGEVNNQAWKSYFPTVYALKETIPALSLMLIALLIGIKNIFKNRNRIKKWLTESFTEIVWLSFIAIYWALSIKGNLNIGVRHVLPTFPFIYMLTAGQISGWVKTGLKPIKVLVVCIFAVWLGMETLNTYPYYLTYYNELAGGPDNGYKYAVDSNLDWGQDLKRLTAYVNENNIEKIKLDYFGGGSPEYYLGNKYERLDANNVLQRHGWLAVSATLLQNGRANAVKGFQGNTTSYKWLDSYTPVTKIGYSIFVYKID